MRFVFHNKEVRVSEVPADKAGVFCNFLANNNGERLSDSEFVFIDPAPELRTILQGIAAKFHITVESVNPLERTLAKIQQLEEKIAMLEKSNAIAEEELMNLEKSLSFS